MKITTTIANSNVDRNGDIINISNLKFPESCPVLLGFDETKFVGNCLLYRHGDELKATFDLKDEYLNLYPSIRIIAGDTEVWQMQDGSRQRIINNAVLICVGLSPAENVSKDIKRLDEK